MPAFIGVTAAYWAFMLSDGALRMLVLLHFHRLGFSPLDLAFLFLLYEIAGIITNLYAGYLATRFGLRSTLFSGLAIQILALAGLAMLDPSWGMGVSVAYVMGMQGASGVAKDLTKMSSKSAVKLLAPTQNAGVFRWVAALTGSKNAIKGFGFFLGAVLLGLFGFQTTLWIMGGGLAAILLLCLIFLPAGLPAGSKGAKFSQIFAKSSNVNWLSAARVFLFGARDVWFVVALPVFFATALKTQGWTQESSFYLTGAFMAAWVIFYGLIQASAPKLLRAKTRALTGLIWDAQRWALIAAMIPLVLMALVWAMAPGNTLALLVAIGLWGFAVVFAINSALHSYLILAFTDDTRVSMDVGFYYMANAAGRLLGTALSGAGFMLGGLGLCLGLSALMLALSAILARRLQA